MPSLALPAHVHMTRSRGREYFAYWPHRGTKRQGRRVPLPGCPTLPDGTPNAAWWAAYRAAAGAPAPRVKAGSFSALAEAWSGGDGTSADTDERGSYEWRRLAPNTRRNYRQALVRILAAWGDLPVRALEPPGVLALRNALEATPGAANRVLVALSSMLVWSIPNGWRATNPCEHVKPFPPGAPWAAWPWAAIEAWRDNADPEMRLALALALYTGQRRSDLLTMTWADVDQGAIRVVHEAGEGQQKTGKRVWVPLHRDLRAELARVERRSTRILTGKRGTPLTLEGFKTLWQRQHERIELLTGACHGLVLHGLRKSAVCFLLEAGCSEEEVEAITRQSREMIRHYAADLNRQRLAARAIAKWENGAGS